MGGLAFDGVLERLLLERLLLARLFLLNERLVD
jgi:hypothetical protein